MTYSQKQRKHLNMNIFLKNLSLSLTPLVYHNLDYD